MNAEIQSQMTLVYYDFRGMAQIIRYLLCYLNEPCHEVLLSRGQRSASLQILQRLNIAQTAELPCLIDGAIIIQDFFAIIRHLCTKASREDLLGETMEQRCIIRQIFYSFMLNKKKEMKLMFQFSEKVAQSPHKKEEIRKTLMEHLHDKSSSSIQMTKLRLKNSNQRYIFGHITVLDFLYYDESFYQVNMFGNLQVKNCMILETINSVFKTDLYHYKSTNSLYLRVMREFKESFEKEPFYLENKEKLESYGLFCPVIPSFTKECFKKVWLGPQHFLK